MQNMASQQPGPHPYQMIRGHSHEHLYGPHPGSIYPPYDYCKFFLLKSEEEKMGHIQKLANSKRSIFFVLSS